MPYGFSGYSQDDMGGYEFVQDDGTPLYAWGPEAEALARRLDETRLQGATAELTTGQPNEPRVPGGYGGYGGGGGSGNTPVARDIESGGGAPGHDLDPDLYGEGTPEPRFANAAARDRHFDEVVSKAFGVNKRLEDPPAAPMIASAPAQSGRPTMQGDTQEPEFIGPVEPMFTIPGSPGRNPQREIAQGVMVPRGSVVTTTSDGEYNPEEARVRAQADLAVQEATRTQAERDATMYLAQSSEARKRAAEMEQQAAEQRARLARARQAAEDQWNEVQKARQAYLEKRVDPQKFFKDQGTFAAIVSAIAQGLGAYGAAMTGGQNYAQQIIQSAVDRDIAAQREEIDSKGRDANNALAVYEKMTGDRDTAEALLRNTMLSVADAERETWGNFVKSEQSRTAFDVWKAQADAANLERERQFKERAMGKTVVQLQNEFAQPSSGTPTRRVPFSELPIEQQLKMKENMVKNRELDQKLMGGNGEVDPEMLEKYGKRKQDVAAFKASLGTLANEIGVRIKPNGEIVKPEGWKGVSGHGATGFAPNFLTTEEGRRFRGAAKQVVANYIRMKSGADATDADAERLTDVALGTWDDDVIAGLQRLSIETKAIEDTIEPSYPIEVIDAYRRNLGRVNREQNQNAPAEREELP